MNPKILKTLLILSLGANVVLTVFLVSMVSSPALFPTKNDGCSYEIEFLKIKEDFGKRYYDLPMEQRQQYDYDYHSLLILNTTQEEFDFHHESILDKYDIDAGAYYSAEEIRSMFWSWIRMCD